MDTSQAVANVVDRLRVEQDISIKALAERSRVARTTLIRRLHGEPFALDEIERVAGVLGTKVSEIARQAEDVA
jgi:transcriptional regulator with XRE-family HTH domain